MSSGKRLSQNQKRSSYSKVSTRGSPSTSRSTSPTTSNAYGPTSAANGGQSSSDSENIDPLTDLEKELFEIVNNGHPQDVYNFLRLNKTVDINKRDIEGFSILQHAVQNNDEEMVDILLKDNFVIEISDSLLLAIEKNYVPIVIKFLKWKKLMREPKKAIITSLFPNIKLDLDSSSDYYGDAISPYLMAAICGHYELLELLHNAGEEMGQLHFPACSCEECGPASSDLQKSNKRIHILKGLTSPTYLAFMAGVDKSFDPILKAFDLANDVITCIKQEPEFKNEYEEILENVNKFPTDLLGLCRNEEEAEILLQQKAGYTGILSPYPRLMLAMDTRQKQFVAHYNAQEVLYQQWAGELGKRWTGGVRMRNFVMWLCIIFSPVVSILLVFTYFYKDSRLGKFLKSPIIRFFVNTVSYIVFLVVIVVMNSQEKARSYLGPPSHYLPWIVGTFVLGHFVNFLKHWLFSSKHFISSGWNIFELINYIFFATSIGCWIKLTFRDEACPHEEIHFYGKCHTLKREWLEADDILFMSEISTGIASTMAGLRFLKPIILGDTLGPLQVALGKISKDLATFLVFFIVMILSFSLGFHHLYKPYVDIKKCCVLCDFESATEALSWALFTMTDVSSPVMPVMNLTNGTVWYKNHHTFTEGVGKFIFMGFHIICVTFLMTMLVGVMSSTYTKIMDNVDIEWKFERSKLWIYYIQDSKIVAPFNIIPNILLMGSFIFFSKTKWCCYAEDNETEEESKARDQRYRALIRRLLQRYFRSRSSHESKDPPAAKDVMHVQKQVVELRQLTTMTLDFHSNPTSTVQVNQTSRL